MELTGAQRIFDFELERTEIEASAIGPREFGIALILIGLVTLAMGRLEHRRDLRLLKNDYPGMPMSGTRIVETLVAVLGALALMAVVRRA